MTQSIESFYRSIDERIDFDRSKRIRRDEGNTPVPGEGRGGPRWRGPPYFRLTSAVRFRPILSAKRQVVVAGRHSRRGKPLILNRILRGPRFAVELAVTAGLEFGLEEGYGQYHVLVPVDGAGRHRLRRRGRPRHHSGDRQGQQDSDPVRLSGRRMRIVPDRGEASRPAGEARDRADRKRKGDAQAARQDHQEGDRRRRGQRHAATASPGLPVLRAPRGRSRHLRRRQDASRPSRRIRRPPRAATRAAW